MYAIVKTGGKQYRVAEGDVLEVEKLTGAPGDQVTLSAVLLVDRDGTDEDAAVTVVTDAAELGRVTVTAEVVGHTKGPKIRIHKFKNKTRYHKRQGHRQALTQVKVTTIDTGRKAKAGTATKTGATKTAATKTGATKAGTAKKDGE